MAAMKRVVVFILFCMAVASFAGADEMAVEIDLTKQAAGLCDEKRYSEAESLLQKAIEADPADAEAHYRLAIVYLKLERPAEAAQEYLKTAGLNEKLARELRMLNPMFSLSVPAKGVATESGFIAAPESERPAVFQASDGIKVK